MPYDRYRCDIERLGKRTTDFTFSQRRTARFKTLALHGKIFKFEWERLRIMKIDYEWHSDGEIFLYPGNGRQNYNGPDCKI